MKRHKGHVAPKVVFGGDRFSTPIKVRSARKQIGVLGRNQYLTGIGRVGIQKPCASRKNQHGSPGKYSSLTQIVKFGKTKEKKKGNCFHLHPKRETFKKVG